MIIELTRIERNALNYLVTDRLTRLKAITSMSTLVALESVHAKLNAGEDHADVLTIPEFLPVRASAGPPAAREAEAGVQADTDGAGRARHRLEQPSRHEDVEGA